MDNGWDHTENEDKVLLNQSWDLGQIKDTDMDIQVTDKVRSMVGTRVGCFNNMSDNYQIDNISSDYNNYLSTLVLNNVNQIHILLYDLIPTNLSYLSTTMSNIDSLIKLCQNIIAQVVKNISSIKPFITNCQTGNSGYQNCLDQIKVKFIDLHPIFLELRDKFGVIIYLKNEAEKIIKPMDLSCSNPNVCRLINAFSCSLSEFAKIECLVISARSTIQEIKKAKDQLMASTSAIPPEHLKSVYFRMKSWSSNIDIIFGAIQDAEINTWCLKYWICKFVSSSNKNSFSTLSVNYIDYYNTFLKLMYNKFYPLFYNLIYFNLSDLDSCISSIISSYYCILSDLNTLETTLIPAAKNTYSFILCNISNLICSVCCYICRLDNLKCAIKKIIFHVSISTAAINKITGRISVNYKINITQLQNSVEKCLCLIQSTKFEYTKLTSISSDITKFKSNIFYEIRLLICLKCHMRNFNMFDESVCRLRRFILWSVPALKTLESSIGKILVDFNKDIEEKKDELKKVEAELSKLEKCVQNKLDSLNKAIIGGITIKGFSISHVMTVECNPPKLTEDKCYKKYKCCLLKQNIHLNNIKTDLDMLKFEDSIGEIRRGASSISELLFKRYLRCSLQSLSTQLNHNITINWDRQRNNTSSSQINNVVVNLISGIVIDESIFVLSRLYVYYKTKDLINETLQILDGCVCLRIYTRDSSDKIETFHKPLPDNKKTWNELMISEMLDQIYNKPRYVCLCLFVRYVLLYGLYKINNKYNEIYMDLLSCMSKSYQKYSYSIGHNFNELKMIMLIVTTLNKILTWMIAKFSEYDNDMHYTIRCFCKNVNTPYYTYLISIILFVSSLLENIWSMDTNSTKIAIEKLSNLLSEYYSLHDNSEYKVLEPLNIPKTPYSLSVRNRGRVDPLTRRYDINMVQV